MKHFLIFGRTVLWCRRERVELFFFNFTWKFTLNLPNEEILVLFLHRFVAWFIDDLYLFQLGNTMLGFLLRLQNQFQLLALYTLTRG
jgi:hypothetical protein